METPGRTGEGTVWDASLLSSSHLAAVEAGHTQSADAVLSHFLQQQHQQAGLTGEHLAVLAAAAAAGSYGAPTMSSTAAADAGHGMAGTHTGITTLPPVPDLQGTTLAYLDHSVGAQGAAAAEQMQQAQQLGEQQLLSEMPGGLADAQQLTGAKRKAGKQFRPCKHMLCIARPHAHDKHGAGICDTRPCITPQDGLGDATYVRLQGGVRLFFCN